MNQEAIFQSAGQALHVSFLMEILPVAQESFMQKAIDDHLRSIGEYEPAMPMHLRTLNFGGLSKLEIRGQCAMIRSAVDNLLPWPEACAVKAYYGHQNTKADGVRGVASFASHSLSMHNQNATLAMAWSVYGTPRQRQGLSIRDIAKEYSLSVTTAQRDKQIIATRAKELGELALGRLEGYFIENGVIENHR